MYNKKLIRNETYLFNKSTKINENSVVFRIGRNILVQDKPLFYSLSSGSLPVVSGQRDSKLIKTTPIPALVKNEYSM